MNKKILVIIVACVLVVLSGASVYLINRQQGTVEQKNNTTTTDEITGNENLEANKDDLQFSDADDQKEIEYSFTQYKTAILNKNSDLAIKYLSQTTIDYYGEMLSLVKNANKTEVQSRMLIDQMMILSVRWIFDEATLSKLNNGNDMLTLAINNGLIGEQSVSGLSINSVKVSKGIAFVELKTNNGVAPQIFKFINENNVWKIDLTSIFPETNIVLQSLAKKSGLIEEEFIFQVLESQTGVRPSDAIWQPISL